MDLNGASKKFYLQSMVLFLDVKRLPFFNDMSTQLQPLFNGISKYLHFVNLPMDQEDLFKLLKMLHPLYQVILVPMGGKAVDGIDL